MAAKAPIIHEPNDYKLYYHTNDEGHVWLDEKNNPTDITEPLTGHTNESEIQTITKDFYHIQTRNKKGEIEMLTLLKDQVPKINKITDTALEEDCITPKTTITRCSH